MRSLQTARRLQKASGGSLVRSLAVVLLSGQGVALRSVGALRGIEDRGKH